MGELILQSSITQGQSPQTKQNTLKLQQIQNKYNIQAGFERVQRERKKKEGLQNDIIQNHQWYLNQIYYIAKAKVYEVDRYLTGMQQESWMYVNEVRRCIKSNMNQIAMKRKLQVLKTEERQWRDLWEKFHQLLLVWRKQKLYQSWSKEITYKKHFGYYSNEKTSERFQ
ncbi:unnamed protein product (macronuclear) [Paramecium tetraurelia]|uniref:Uncharacterized protein n=1 Tax=Paramecium tetraurelia TaxID=5888 RepID=A0E4R8_PARTE|nr:uncharacterized protein GSPATT00023460001 [Paramecium tetraurelia]CAK90285.1 unnamed protein product [Paramecium tetraurelia]|eukprot:XP_001457682.1 hypothetical protein (macronuclear) [Paramecium tetraurelia strain d4-2]